jgi:DNA-directed RNA polymerase subunit RPC12/RpoP
MVGLSCVNCKREVVAGEEKFFDKVYLCPDCHRIALRVLEKGERELKMMLMVLRESIRLAIVQHKLQFNEQNLDDMKEEDMVSVLHALAKQAKEQPCPTKVSTKIPSTGTTSLVVRPADAKPK